jgi:hypothetical protein
MRNKKDTATKVGSDENPPLLGFYEVSIQVFIDDVNFNIYGDDLRALDEIGRKACEMGWRFKFRPISFVESLYSVPGLNFERKEQNRICAARSAEKSA